MPQGRMLSAQCRTLMKFDLTGVRKEGSNRLRSLVWRRQSAPLAFSGVVLGERVLARRAGKSRDVASRKKSSRTDRAMPRSARSGE